jgi:hypothetical protein
MEPFARMDVLKSLTRTACAVVFAGAVLCMSTPAIAAGDARAGDTHHARPGAGTGFPGARIEPHALALPRT